MALQIQHDSSLPSHFVIEISPGSLYHLDFVIRRCTERWTCTGCVQRFSQQRLTSEKIDSGKLFCCYLSTIGRITWVLKLIFSHPTCPWGIHSECPTEVDSCCWRNKYGFYPGSYRLHVWLIWFFVSGHTHASVGVFRSDFVAEVLVTTSKEVVKYCTGLIRGTEALGINCTSSLMLAQFHRKLIDRVVAYSDRSLGSGLAPPRDLWFFPAHDPCRIPDNW